MRQGNFGTGIGIVTTRKFDAAAYLETEGDVLAFLDAAWEGGDPEHIANALGIVARSQA